MRGVAETEGLTRLTAREQEVLELMAEGFSNRGICARLCLSPKTVEAHVRNIFRALGIEQSSDYHRRVLAVLFHVHVSH